MGCFGPKKVYTLHTVGHNGATVYVFVFTKLEKAVDHAMSMGWPGRKWIMECTPDYPDLDEIQVWERTGI